MKSSSSLQGDLLCWEKWLVATQGVAAQLIVTPDKHHEMDIPELLKFLGDAP